MISQNIRLGKIMGIEVGVNYSWFIVFALVTIILATAYFPQAYPNLGEVTYFTLGIVTSLLFFFSVLFHEMAHSLVAKSEGIPIKSITLFVFGGVSTITKEPERPADEFKMAVAGPLSSFVLGGAFYVIYLISQALGLGVLVSAPAFYLALINVILGVFNLVPGFPLDGGRVFRSIVWSLVHDLRRATRAASVVGQAFAFILIFGGLVFIFLAGNLVTGVWFIFIGWFLHQAAVASYEQVVVRGTLQGVRVGDFMTRDVKTVDASLTLTDLVNENFMRYKHGRFPVIDDGRLLGVVSLHEVRDVPREKWSTTAVREVTPPLSPGHTVSPADSAEEAMARMADKGIGHLVVMEDGHLIGIVTKSDLMAVIQTRRGLGY